MIKKEIFVVKNEVTYIIPVNFVENKKIFDFSLPPTLAWYINGDIKFSKKLH